MMKKVAVVGFGFMGMTHTLNILKNDKLQLAAIVDKEADQIDEKIKSESGNFSTGDINPSMIRAIPRYADLSSCLQQEEVDIVMVCVHTDLHIDIATEALNEGKHVFVEKPITLDLNRGEALIRLAKERERILMVGQVLRFMPPYQQLKKWIDSGEFGTLKFLSMSRYSGVPAWGQWKEKQTHFGSSGGALFDLVIHDIDFLQYVLGAPDSIRSTVMPGALSNHDYVNAIWNYPNGLQVKVEGGNIFHTNFPFQAGYMASFERASISFSTCQPEIIQVATNEDIKQIEAGDGNDGFYNELDYFATCVSDNQPPVACMPESALDTIKLCYNHI